MVNGNVLLYILQVITTLPIPPNSFTTIYATRKYLEKSIVSTRSSTETTNKVKEEFFSRPLKRKRIDSEIALENNKHQVKLEVKEEQNDFFVGTFWDSPEAKRWFGRGDDDDVEETMRQSISLFRDGYVKAEGWRQLVSDNYQNNMCTSHDIYLIRSKAMYFCIALNTTSFQHHEK